MSLSGNFFRKIKAHIVNYFTQTPYEIISLGPNCYPRTVLSRTHLIKHRIEGQKTYPFDFAWIHKAKYVTEFLNNNFENFLSELKYSEYCSSWDNGNKINFSHEAFITSKQKNKLIRIYKKRIKNFLTDIKKDKSFVFLQILKDYETGEDCKNTYQTLKNIFGERKFVYAVADFIGIVPEDIPSEIRLIRLNLPSVKTDVFSKEFYLSQTGINTENEISEFVKKIIREELNLAPVQFL